MRRFLRFLTGALVLITVGACSSPDEQPSAPAFKNARALYNQDSLSKALPLFKQAADAAPENGVARAWVAVVHEQMGNWAKADTIARTALSLSTCNNVAHTVLSDIYNPQYGWDRANADTAWVHAQQAVKCDETDGNAWLSIWNLSVKRDRWEQARTAMRRLHETDFIPPKMQAVARWQLRVLPDSALFLTNGDWDTYPPLAVQAAAEVRTDVAVVNFNMLNAVDYADQMIETHDLPRAMSKTEMEAYTLRRGENGRGIYLSDTLLRHWRDRLTADAMDRPLLLAPTIRADAIRKNPTLRTPYVG